MALALKWDHEFESAFLQQRVRCEPDFGAIPPARFLDRRLVAFRPQAANGLVVEDGRARYTGTLYERLRQASPGPGRGVRHRRARRGA